MKKTFILLTSLLFLAACGDKETGQENEEVVIDDTAPMETPAPEPEAPELVVGEEINQLGDDAFTDLSETLPEEYIIDKDGDYTYVMFENKDDAQSEKNTSFYLSILKDNIWIKKDVELLVEDAGKYTEITMLGKTLFAHHADLGYTMLTYNEKGEVEAEETFSIMDENPDFSQSETIATTFGTTLLLTDEDVFYHPEENKFTPLSELADYLDLEKNLALELEDTTLTAYDLEKNEPVYDDETGQEKSWTIKPDDLVTMGLDILGQDKDGNYYMQDFHHDSVDIYLYDEAFNELAFQSVEITSENIGKTEVIDGTLYYYEALEFKGKPALRLVSFN